jgi:hypothetical protein
MAWVLDLPGLTGQDRSSSVSLAPAMALMLEMSWIASLPEAFSATLPSVNRSSHRVHGVLHAVFDDQ